MSKEPDPAVVASAERREFSAKYKLPILAQADENMKEGREPAGLSVLRRCDGLSSISLDELRKQIDRGKWETPHEFSPSQKIARTPDLLAAENARLVRENTHLRARLEIAEHIFDHRQEVGAVAWDDVQRDPYQHGAVMGSPENLAQAIPVRMDETDDVARLIAQEQRLRHMAEQHAGELNRLLAISQMMSSTLDLQRLLDLILDQIEQVVGCTGSVFLCLEGAELAVMAGRKPAAYGRVTNLRFSAAPLLDNLALFRGPVVVDDLRQSGPVQSFLRQLLGDRVEMLLKYGSSWMGVPLLVGDRLLGILALTHSQPGYYANVPVDFVLAFARQAAVAIGNAQLYQQAKVTAADDERNRLAQELHDAVTQTLFTASIIADALSDAWDKSPEMGRRGLEDLRTLTRGALAEMRALLLELRPATLIQKPLAEILKPLSEAFQSRAALDVDQTILGDNLYPAEVQIAFYRIIQEAFNNISKHANASQVNVDLDCQSDHYVELTLQDNGMGFSIDQVAPDRMGLSIMQERAESIGAAWDLQSEPAKGTRIHVRWQVR